VGWRQPFRISGMAYSSIPDRPLEPQFWPRHDARPHSPDCTSNFIQRLDHLSGGKAAAIDAVVQRLIVHFWLAFARPFRKSSPFITGASSTAAFKFKKNGSRIYYHNTAAKVGKIMRKVIPTTQNSLILTGGRVRRKKEQQMVGGPRQCHLAALRRGEWPTPWIWEIFHRGKPLIVRMWGGYFFFEKTSARLHRECVRANLPCERHGHENELPRPRVLGSVPN
jgi:hypothetical protein